MYSPDKPEQFLDQAGQGVEHLDDKYEEVINAVKEAGYDEEVAERLNDALVWLSALQMTDPYINLDQVLTPETIKMASEETDVENLAAKIKDALVKGGMQQAA